MNRQTNIIELHQKRRRVYEALADRAIKLDIEHGELWKQIELLRSVAQLVTIDDIRRELVDTICRLEAKDRRICRQRDKLELWAAKIYVALELMYSAYARIHSVEVEFPYDYNYGRESGI